ncbi:phosphoribosylaminoimidazolesuccinocarboxamide synthase [Leptolyngbya sp. FACHB-261]|uniref:phosphoribosylaminoimidazolesuccinocarboxamide synthase n=1 Tax=Leptolyngbya sp. FACHB-261 TaxID=2692806 RepID=UPI00168487EC|nr:phosphoribosylaminoimidazolesuccinocarboxamide synthase [Leptolyngbya sp. FACHB-261]MBD2101168.1 phosphoribosylaminoimidazolesuccinocarboxamide synthase [Leptolyngbya sp. FACHB-261]
MDKLYEGKAKILYTTDNPGVLLSHFKDDATAFNARKRGTIVGKGQINCSVSAHLFRLLEGAGVATHFIDQTAPDEMQVKTARILPLEVVVRNIAAGSLTQRTGLQSGTVLKHPLVEFFYKNDELGDPLVTTDHIELLELATPSQIQQLRELSLRVNSLLQRFFEQCGITLVDFKLEFGIDQTPGSSGGILLADEISPDTCRLWDSNSSDPQARVLDKDRFRLDLGGIEGAYQTVMERILAQPV